MKKKAHAIPEDDILIPEGERVTRMASLAGTMRHVGFGHDAILAALQEVNDRQTEFPLDEEKIEDIARSISRYAPAVAKVASDFYELPDTVAMKASEINIEHIPKRDWIMSSRYLGGFVSVIIAPGGVGKSSLSILDAVAIATGNPLTGFDIVKPGAVWIYNTEDSLDEIKRRIAAISMYYKIPLSDLKNVYISSGRDHPLIFAKTGQNGIEINTNAIESTAKFIHDNKIVLLIIDPFIRCHEVDENSNVAIDKVVWCLQRIIDKTGCAIGLVHHTSKAGYKLGSNKNGDEPDMYAARGATALINAARIAHVLITMSEKEAKKLGINPEIHRWYMRLDNAKANLQPPAKNALWFQKINMTLCNGDEVGTIEPVDLIDIEASNKQVELKTERSIYGEILDDYLNIGEEMKVTDFVSTLKKEGKYAHLITVTSEKQQKANVIKVLEGGITFGEKCFKYIQKGSERNPNRNWIVCTKITKERTGNEVETGNCKVLA